MALTNPLPRYCDYCGSKFRQRYPTQRFCRPWCRNEGKAAEGRSARRSWWAQGRPMINEAVREEPKHSAWRR